MMVSHVSVDKENLMVSRLDGAFITLMVENFGKG